MTKDWKQWEGQLVNGEFHLRQYLGGSDHSAVFLTERGGGEPKKVAVKLIPVDAGDTEVQLARWELAAKLSHPHLLRLFQTGRCQLGSAMLLYVVMEYAEEDLSQILPERPLTPMEARQMLQPVLNALAFLHGKRFVHGHVKPANIMAVNDQLRISSDGLCAVGQSSVGVGRPSVYDPPDGASGIISPAADIWSLGVTLVEALTQRLPVWRDHLTRCGHLVAWRDAGRGPDAASAGLGENGTGGASPAGDNAGAVSGYRASLSASRPSAPVDRCRDRGATAADLTRNPETAGLTRSPETNDCQAAAKNVHEVALPGSDGRRRACADGDADKPKTIHPSPRGSACPFHCGRTATGSAKGGAEFSTA